MKNVIEPDRAGSCHEKHSISKVETESILPVRTLCLPDINLSPGRITRLLAIIVIALIIANWTALSTQSYFASFSSSSGQYTPRLFNLDAEMNIPTVYAGLSLAFSALLLALIAYMKNIQMEPFRKHWAFLAFIFMLMAVDEMAVIHEVLISLRPMLNTSGIFHFAWVIPGLAFVVLMGLAYWKFLLALPKTTRILFLLAGAMFVGGALGMEMVGGQYADSFGGGTPVYMAITSIEESLEMFGIVVFVYALLTYIRSHIPSATFVLSFED